MDQQGQRPLEFVNVILQTLPDSALVTGAVTDRKGGFDFKGLPTGRYICRISLMGYQHKATAAFLLDAAHRHVNLGKLQLTETAVSLDEVLITRQKSLLNSAIDRKIYNVDQDLMSKSGSASDVLQKVPSVEVDIDGGVSLRGSSSVLILINGKNSPLMGKSRAEVLEQMPASTIDRIEVITNPSAKFKPDGSSGIINIVLKKNSVLGMNGSIGANAGNQSRYNSNLRLNYNPGALNLFSTYSVRKDTRNRINADVREQLDASGVPALYREDMVSYSNPLSHMVTLGFDYELDDLNSIGASGNYFYNRFTRTESSKRVFQNSGRMTIGLSDRNRTDYEFESEYGGTLYVEHKFAKEDQKIHFEATASTAPEQEDNRYTDVFWFPQATPTYDNTVIKQKETQYEIALDYSDPITEESKLEAGYMGEFNRSDLDFSAEVFDPGRQRFVKDILKTNRFLFDENLHALYATYEHSFGLLGLMGGLRIEQAFLTSNLITTDSTLSSEYASLYPTLHMRYTLSDAAELQLNYSRRTHRPEADDLNPFPEYRDPRNISAGNPGLKPEYIHSVELGCKLQNDFFTVLPSIYYRYTYNRFTSITLPLNDTTLLTTHTNLANDRSAGLELVLSTDLGEWLSMHGSANAYYNQIDASNLGYGQKKSTVTWSGALTASANLAQGATVQLNTRFNSARLTPQGRNSPSYVVNIGARQELLDGKVSLMFTIADLFKTQKRETLLDIPLLKQSTVNTRDTQVLYFGFTYHFGNPSKKKEEEGIKYDDGI